MSPESIEKCKRNIAAATGTIAPVACATSAIKWSFKDGKYNNQSADPRTDTPFGQIKSWMRIWRRATTSTQHSLQRLWPKCYAKLKAAKTGGKE